MTNLSPERQYAMLRRMITIRRFEEIASEKFRAGDIYGVVHAYSGEEAVAVGVCEALRDGDQIISTHRGHGHCIAKGADLNRMMAELYGRADGYCKGKGGSMHIADFSIGMLGANGIVAGGISIITGAGLASQMDDKGAVAVGFFGDGASNAGPFHESINIAASWKLPVVYVCENNQWAVNVPAEESVATPNVADRAQGYGIPGVIVDGNDVYAVHNAAVDAVARARAGQGPTLIEAKTYRHRRHTERLDQPDARPPEQIEAWLQEDKDPIARMISLLQSQSDLLPNERLEELKTIVEEDLATAVSFAEKSPFPSKESALEDVFSGSAK
jgi:TPP-dependent pyruvate/acetoin dehydrogenase alpha subunit